MIAKMPNKTMTLAACLAATITLAAAPAWAGKRGGESRSLGTVTACSSYGEGCYTAPVRQTRLGPQMRLKGGMWIYCEGDCRDTLRRETVDFWHDQRERNK